MHLGREECNVKFLLTNNKICLPACLHELMPVESSGAYIGASGGLGIVESQLFCLSNYRPQQTLLQAIDCTRYNADERNSGAKREAGYSTLIVVVNICAIMHAY